MIFNTIAFENYRPYYGSQSMELYKKNDDYSPYKKNITLVGGLNGAGKTSLINAFHICFYGRRKFNKEEYEVIKNEAINRRYFREGGRESKIQLSFSDRTGTYLIEVMFKMDNKDEVQEVRKIFVLSSSNEAREVATSEEEFNNFIDQRIPIDVAPFFIFDAEKIRDLVGEHDKKETIAAIQKIVSLELYNQLYDDISSIRYKDSLSYGKSVKDEEIAKITQELEKTASELDSLRSQDKPDDKKIEYLQEEKNFLNQERRRKLSNSSQTKAQVSRRIGELEAELKRVITTIESFGRSSLPKIIMFPLVRTLQQRIRKEQSYISEMSRSKAMFAPFDNFISQLLNQAITPPLNDIQRSQLKEKGKDVWLKLNKLQEVKVEPQKVLHANDLSQNEIQSVLSWALPGNTSIKDWIDKKINMETELKSLYKELEDAPELVDTKEEDEKLAQISEQLGAIYIARKTRSEAIRRLHDLHHQLQNDLTRKRQTKKDLGPIEKKLELMNRLVSATKDFIDQVTVLKAQQLKNEIETILLQLFRKKDLNRVEFDSNDFTLRIYDEFDREVDLTSRSEGEKQLIALSMIWALTKVSGTDFPFVIDTPLARLDSIHRSNLVNRFFTNLSEQVIILTTDTEITKDFVEEIDPFVQKSFLLRYDDEENSTKISEGYFTFE